MSEKKPEWFEIAESDDQVPTPQKSRLNPKPIIAFAVSGLIIGAGAIIANAQDEAPANAETTQVQNSAVAVADNGPAPSDNETIGATEKSNIGLSQPGSKSSGLQNPGSGGASSGIQNPVTHPQRGDDGEEFGEHHGPRPDHHDRDGEGGDHERRFGDDD